MRRFLIAAFWATLSAACAETPACEPRVFEQSRFLVCRYDAANDTAALVLADRKGVPLRSFRRLKQFHPGWPVRFAMNAGMFEADGRPVGLYVEKGRTIRALNTADADGNFYLKPNGVFAVYADGSVAVETAEEFAADTRTPVFATQSGPMLVSAGALHPKFSEDGRSKYVRNGVGVAEAQGAYFVISQEPVSFGRLARFFRDALACPNALYFDGTVSSLWWPQEERRDNASPLGPMIVVSEKPR